MERVAIISVDGHVKAPRAGYRDYIDPKWRGAFDEWVKRFEGTPDGFVRADFESGQWDPKRRVADLETQGVAAEVLFANGRRSPPAASTTRPIPSRPARRTWRSTAG